MYSIGIGSAFKYLNTKRCEER